MDEFEVQVVGARRQPKARGRLSRFIGLLGRLLRALLMRPRLMILVGIAGFVLFVGTPHAGWDYVCRHPFRYGDPCRSVLYCAYYGMQGRREVFPPPGETCKLITFLPIDWQRII